MAAKLVIRTTYFWPGRSAGSVIVVSSELVVPCWEAPTTWVSPSERPSPLASRKICMSQSLVGAGQSTRTLAFALSIPAALGTVNGWSLKQLASSDSASAQGAALGPAAPEKLSGGLGSPVWRRGRSAWRPAAGSKG